MEVSAKREGSQLELALKGELDHHGAKGLFTRMERELELHLPKELVLDLAGVGFMDSAGIAVAVRAWQRMREMNGTVTLKNVAPQPRKVFRAAGVERMMPIL